MSSDNNWYHGISRQLERQKYLLSEGDYKKYRLRLLLCIAERTAGLSPECEECTAFKQDISALANNVGNLVQIGEKENRKAHKKTMDRMISHLQKAHNIVTEGYYTGMWIGIGTALGLPFGIPLGNISFGIPIGLAIGAAIGLSLENKAKKEGRILCPKDSTSS